MTTDFLYDFISKNKYSVLSTVNINNRPESALVGFAVTPDLKIIFDTVSNSRKYKNLLINSSVALVFGSDDWQTIQYEGIAKIPIENELNELLEYYFKVFPEGGQRRESWQDIAHFCVEPKWIRYSDFHSPYKIEERRF
jgi:uncharacterized pyridoxamine 5'-phosphate oxidase family protein